MRILQRERIFENNPGEQFFIPFIDLIAAVALVVADHKLIYSEEI